MIEFASGQITGQRAAQEDSLGLLRLDGGASAGPANPTALDPAATTPLNPGLVLVVADGMGGHVGGRVASGICVRAFLEGVSESSEPWGERLERALNAANAALRVETENHPELAGMGSTLIGAVVGDAGLGWISIGDSALYHFRGAQLTRINEDHSFGAYLDQQARDGLMTSDAAASDRRRNHLFYALLGDELDHYERFSGFRDLAAGDLVIAASDGLKTLSDERIAALLIEHGDRPMQALVDALLRAVDDVGRDRQDNVSIIAARVTAGSAVLPGEAVAVAVAARRDAPTKPVPLAAPRPDAIQARRLRYVGIAVIAAVVLGVVAIGVAQFL